MAFVGATIFLPGCAREVPQTRVFLTDTTVNGHSARLVLDTGSACLGVFKPGAKRFELGASDVSAPVALTMGDQSMTIPIPIIDMSDDQAAGIIGWPVVSQNILKFDADHSMVTRLDRLPKETAGWLKLKILPKRLLTLELPASDGTTAVIYVDTGSSTGLQMSAAQWKVWKAAHSEVPATAYWSGFSGTQLHRTSLAFADKVNAGPLTLTDVLVEEMGSEETTLLQNLAGNPGEVWVLGMDALARLDLVVDAVGGYAYLQAKPPDPTIKASQGSDARAGNSTAPRHWTLAQNVRLNGGQAFEAAGEYKLDRADFSGAIADLSRALELNPYNADAYSNRGVARESQGDYAQAVADYDRYIELEPEDSDYERLYRRALLLRLNDLRYDPSKTVALCQGGWPKILGQFLTGTLDENTLLNKAKASQGEDVPAQEAMAYYYIGMVRLSKGDKPGARTCFQKCCGSSEKSLHEYWFSKPELKQLSADKP
jgi:tetratricopeptide (TPR) repeat protein